MTEINPEHLATRIAQFRDDRRALQEMVVACFPIGCRVVVQETGEEGKVISTVSRSPDLMHVALSFGRCMALNVLDLERIA